LTAGSPTVEFDVRFENKVRDHRLRARFPFQLLTTSVWSDGHFYTNQRPLQPPLGTDWVQPPTGQYPQQDFSLLQDSTGGVAVFNRGLPEIETRLDPEVPGVGLDLTLLRAVGWLSRDDFPTRRSQNAGPTIPTPGAQCLGPQRFQYAIHPFAGDWRGAEVKMRSQEWHVPSLLVQGVEDGARTGGQGLVQCLGAGVAVTAIKKHETRDSLVVRLYGLLEEPTEATLRVALPIQRAWLCNVLEARDKELEPNGRDLTVLVDPYRIVTVEIVI
jgi:alpha-mannosidase